MTRHGTYTMRWLNGCHCEPCRAYQAAKMARRRAARAQRRRRREVALRVNRARWAGVRDGRIEDYAELRSWGLTRQQAADRLGFTRRTIERYEAELKARGQVAA